MDSNFWFYTLSTIPQTLGAVIALSATFVIFKLNHIESRIKKECDEIKEWIMPLLPEIEIHEITKLDDSGISQKLKEGVKILNLKDSRLGIGDGRYNKLYDLYKGVILSYKRKFEPTRERIYEYLREKDHILTSLLEVRKNALYHLEISLSLTVLPIVGSIVFLPLYNQITYRTLIVLVLIVLAIIGICYTAYSVWRIAHLQLR